MRFRATMYIILYNQKLYCRVSIWQLCENCNKSQQFYQRPLTFSHIPRYYHDHVNVIQNKHILQQGGTPVLQYDNKCLYLNETTNFRHSAVNQDRQLHNALDIRNANNVKSSSKSINP